MTRKTFFLTLVAVCISTISCSSQEAKIEDLQSQITDLESKIEEIKKAKISSLDTLEKAEKYLIGTWTFTYTNEIFPYADSASYSKETDSYSVVAARQGYAWARLDLYQNGTYEVYQAEPVSNDWGNVIVSGTWEAIKDKYIDDGTPYYAVRLSRSKELLKTVLYNAVNKNDLILRDDGSLRLIQWSGSVENTLLFQKGDKFPFHS